jgi:hypothetical protein
LPGVKGAKKLRRSNVGYEYEVYVTVTLETEKRCNNDCVHLSITLLQAPKVSYIHPELSPPDRFSATCTLFKQPLTWDKRYKTNGYRRCKECSDSDDR